MTQNKKQNYHILSLIGQGAYGSVYKARKKYTGQFVAIKSIKKKGKQEKDIKVMRDQIQILKKLKHQNIILLLDSFQTSSEFILVTQLGQGQLFNIIEDDQSLQESQIRKIAQQLIRALHYIHSNRITHRDMKPQNILMTSEGHIKLCDFGFARQMSYKTEVLTSLKGTPLYMAPQVVKEEPYNHTADLWSLGVILYELATGTPPFTAPNLITLVQHISKDPIIYPQYITGDFKGFLKGLLNKDPKKRLGWPDLLNHSFIKETEIEKMQRKKKNQKFSTWLQSNMNEMEEELASKGSPLNPRPIMSNNEVSGVSPRRQNSSCNDAAWNKYLTMSSEEKGASALRTDPNFLDNLLKVLETNINEVVRVRQKRNVLGISLKVLMQILLKSKAPDNKKFDNTKNLNIPNLLLSILRSLLKFDNGKQHLDLIADITKLIGLLEKSSFNKSFGIEMVYIRSFVPLLPSLIKCCSQDADQQHQMLANNFLRTIGIFANNAAANHIRSFSFYKDLIEKKFVQQFMQIYKSYQDNLGVLKLFVQVLSAFMHPVFGDIECFPWKRDNSAGIQEYKQCSTMLECVKQTVINSLQQSNFSDLFEKILMLEEQNALLPKVSVMRIILQSTRQSQDFTIRLLFQQKSLLRLIFSMLHHKDQVVYGTICQIVAQLIRYSREMKKTNVIEGYAQNCLEFALSKLKDKSMTLAIFGSLALLQELVVLEGIYFNKIIEAIEADRYVLRTLLEFISNSSTNKLEEMRKIEGSNYGLHIVALYDPMFLFLHRLLIKTQRQTPKKFQQLTTSLQEQKYHQKISNLLINLSSKTDLSPKGLISLLMVVNSLMANGISDQFADERVFSSFICLLKQSQTEVMLEWPVNFGGGETCINALFGNLMKIFFAYLQEGQKEPEVVQIIFKHNLVEQMLSFTKHLSTDTISSVTTFMTHLLSFDKPDNTLSSSASKSFIRQFIDANGMALFVRFHLLKSTHHPSTSIIESCNLLSQIARFSKDVYEHIDSIDPTEDLVRLIQLGEVQVRSRVLNLIGNMCRHSNYFYDKVGKSGILKHCISLCGDSDKTIKKFACVAIGNASFHDDSLYELLRAAIPVLVPILKDSQEKTRSNAAAALGNLARNSDILDRDIASSGAIQQLVNMISSDKSAAAKKVSIMAVTNLLDHPESRKLLLNLEITKVLTRLHNPPLNTDATLMKSVTKALDKLK